MRGFRFALIALFLLRFDLAMANATDNHTVDAAVVQSPPDCLGLSNQTCFLKTSAVSSQFKWREHTITMGPEAVVQFNSDGSLRLLLGNIQVDSKGPLRLQTSFVQVTFEGSAWFEHGETKTWIRNLDSQMMSYEDTLQKEKLGLQIGFEIWISKLDTKKRVVKGVVQPLASPRSLLEMQNEFGKGFVSTLMIQRYLKAWQGNAEMAGEQYQVLVKRQMASLENRDQQKHLRSERERKANVLLREMFRRRNVGEEL